MINAQSLLDAIMGGVLEGAQGSLELIAERARQLAPVRKIIRGNSRRRVGGRPEFRSIATVGEPFRARNPFLKSIERIVKVQSPDLNIREVRRAKGGGFRLANPKVKFRVAGEMRMVDLQSRLLGRARRDLRVGQGLFKNTFGETQYGGTLKGSIEVLQAARIGGRPGSRGTEIVGFVKASAIEHGFNYAYAQEFGTRHNKAQPFLRPAFREHVRRIGNVQTMSIKQRLALRGGFTKSRAAGRVKIKVTATFGPSFERTVLVINNRLDRAFAVR